MSVAGFKVLLHRRSMTINGLAREAKVGRSHLSQVLNGKPGRGGQTRRKVARLLTAEELARLGWDHKGKILQEGTERTEGNGNVSTGLPRARSSGGRFQSRPELARTAKVMVSASQNGKVAAPDGQGKGEGPHPAAFAGKTILDLERK